VGEVETYELSKVYRGGVRALDGITLALSGRGPHIVASPNGAGKTTLLRILYTAFLPTSGRAYVLGYDVAKDAKSLRKLIAVVPQETRPEPYLTPRQFVELYLIARGFSRADAVGQSRYALEVMGLDSVKDGPSLTLSSGERKRVLIAAALAANSEVMFLDEPTEGLDPVGRARVYEELRRITRRGTMVIMTTRHLDEAEEAANNVVLINRGRLVAVGDPDKLLSSVAYYRYKVVVRGVARGLVERLRGLGVGAIERVDGNVVIYVDQRDLKEVLGVLSEAAPTFVVEKVSLDDVFRIVFG